MVVDIGGANARFAFAEPFNPVLKLIANCAVETMNTFFSVLGSVAGKVALTLGAQGGVHLAGGIAPPYIDLLTKSDFRARFLAKGRLADFNGEIATFVITHPAPGLLGAALICAPANDDGC